MQNTDFILNNLVDLLRKDKFTTLYFLLENNRADFLTILKKSVPKILLNPFFAEIESKDNFEVAEFLAVYLSKADYIQLDKYKITYNLGAENWTTDQKVKDFLGISENNERGTIGDFGNWFTTFVSGTTTTTQTTTTTDVSNKNTTIAIIGVIALIFILTFIYFKFAKNGKK